jgi:hypothetical protein
MPDSVPVDTSRIQYAAIAMSVVLMVVVIELIRRNRLREQYALVWLACAFVLLFFSVWRSALDALARFLGIAYGPSLILLMILGPGVLLLVHFSIVISRLSEENKHLAQELAMLAERVDGGPGPAAGEEPEVP